ncbi:MAG: condensation domain-containing protein, partial [Actinobacteria bacterium]|nr:condensation domain-containing protein [Actinomycetota bacterium]
RVVWDGVPQPLLVIQRQVNVPITHYDWRELPDHTRQHQHHQLLATDRATGMDLDRAPLLRLAIARYTDDEVLLVWAFHHVTLDGWSLAQVLTEVSEHYAALIEGRPAELVARRPFRDYLHWLTTQDQAQAQAYWRQILAGFESPTPLPYDRAPIEAHRTESAQSVSLQLSIEQSTRLREMAQHNGLTVNTIVQGAWALLLSRYSNQPDVVFGTTVSGRPGDLPGVEDMIGMFINTIPTRITIPEANDVVSWLRGLQADQVESRRYDFVSLTQLQAWSDLPPGTNLFNSAVVFENYPFDEQSIAHNGLHIHDIQAIDTTNFALTAAAFLDQQLSITLGYDPAL